MDDKHLPENDHTLVEWFDDKLDEFHSWLNELREQREQNIQTQETQELESFPEIRKKDTGTTIARESLWKFWII